jgi:hypothetical protein
MSAPMPPCFESLRVWRSPTLSWPRAVEGEPAMPFDATDRWPAWCLKTDPTGEQSRLVLDMMQSFFGEDGRNWTQGVWEQWDGRCCLIGAVGFIRRQIGSDDDRVPEYLARAIGRCGRRRTPKKTIARIVTDYNERAAGFVEIAAVIGKAKALAEADMQAARQVAR